MIPRALRRGKEYHQRKEIGAPFTAFGPGPHWTPKPRRRTLNIDDMSS